MTDAKKIKLTTPEESIAPIFYADQPAAIAIGPHISRLTFGVEAAGDYPQPVVTLAIPTIALLEFIRELSATFDDPDFKKNVSDSMDRSKAIISHGTKSSISPKVNRSHKGDAS